MLSSGVFQADIALIISSKTHTTSKYLPLTTITKLVIILLLLYLFQHKNIFLRKLSSEVADPPPRGNIGYKTLNSIDMVRYIDALPTELHPVISRWRESALTVEEVLSRLF
jgi:hypothetical protein